jgi:hypothetical protein
MINLHLLTRVSGYDHDFKRTIISMINTRFQRVRTQLLKLIEQRSWASCYLHLEEYLYDLQPYSNQSFVEDLKQDLKRFKNSQCESERERILYRFIATVEFALATASAAVHEDQVEVK